MARCERLWPLISRLMMAQPNQRLKLSARGGRVIGKDLS